MRMHLDLASGLGGFSVASNWAGYTTIGFCEIDPWCRRVLAKNFPGVPQHDDLKTLSAGTVREWIGRTGRIDALADAASDAGQLQSRQWQGLRDIASEHGEKRDHQLSLLTAGYPCFAGGTMVLARDGYRPIESLAIGDAVLTHRGRWRPITSVTRRDNADLVSLYAQGVPGVVTTPEHPFFAKKRGWFYPRLPEGKRGQVRIYADPEWIAAGDLTRDCYLGQVLPEATGDNHSAAFWWLAGRILADGWIGDQPGRPDAGRVTIACASDEAGDLLAHIEAAGFHAYRTDERTVVKFAISRNDLYCFMREFGRHAHGKLVPGWALELDQERSDALLTGWLSGDGSRGKNEWRGTTVSKALALGMALVAQRARGVVASVRLCAMPDRTVIEGRSVNQRPFYVVSIPDGNHVAVVDGPYGWKQFRRSASAGVGTVYNISVDEDESYVADGAIVHNCQPFSLAGKRLGATDDRHLWPWIAALVAELRPERLLLENVYGHVSMGLDDALADLEALGYACGAVVIPAAAVGAPHRRDRVWLLAHADPAREPQSRGPQREVGRRSRDGGRPGGESGPRRDAADADGGRRQQRDAGERRLPEPDALGDAADSQSAGLEEHGRASGTAAGFAGLERAGRADAADAAPRGLRRGRASGRRGQPAQPDQDGASGQVERGVGDEIDGLPRRILGCPGDRGPSGEGVIFDQDVRFLWDGSYQEAVSHETGVRPGLRQETVLQQRMLGEGEGEQASYQIHDAEALTASFPEPPALPGVRVEGPSAAASPELLGPDQHSVSVSDVPCKGRSARRVPSNETVSDLPDLRDELQPLHPRPQQDLLESVPVGTREAERDETMASRGWNPGPARVNPWDGDWEEGCPRTQARESERVNKLKALGNAIVPSVAYAILSIWDEAEDAHAAHL